jgi:hypothetical protein
MRKAGTDSSQFRDFTGKRFGKLEVLGFSHYKHQPSGQRKTQWGCRCDCGNLCIVAGYNLTTDHTTSCGCHKAKMKAEGHAKYCKDRRINGVDDLVGKQFGRLTVISFNQWVDKEYADGVTYSEWLCQCSCGEVCTKLRPYLSGNSSCGCYKSETISAQRTTHGMTETPTYKIWLKMKERCLTPNERQQGYKDKDIKVCSRWLESFENFLEDMGERPEGLSLDRVNTYGNYEPSNCRWADDTLQSFNRSKQQSKSGYTGVYEQPNGLYRATIGYYNKIISLARNVTLEEAISARKAGELKYYGFNKE